MSESDYAIAVRVEEEIEQMKATISREGLRRALLHLIINHDELPREVLRAHFEVALAFIDKVAAP